jgi:hypothetical protein
MANGYWGGRFPIDNFLFSRFIFFGVRWRRITQLLRGYLRQALRLRMVKLSNDASTSEALKKWLDQGYAKFNIGGGEKNLEGFINIDFLDFPEVKRGIVANILDLSFMPTGCASQIHSNHVVEHLTDDQLKFQLKEYNRILKEQGLLTVRCPNVLGAAYGFWFEPVIEGEKDQFIELGFPADEKLADPSDKWLHKDLFGLLHWFYGEVGSIENQHRNLITPTKIKNYIEESGFQILKMTDPEALNIVVVARKL